MLSCWFIVGLSGLRPSFSDYPAMLTLALSAASLCLWQVISECRGLSGNKIAGEVGREMDGWNKSPFPLQISKCRPFLLIIHNSKSSPLYVAAFRSFHITGPSTRVFLTLFGSCFPKFQERVSHALLRDAGNWTCKACVPPLACGHSEIPVFFCGL